MFFLFLVWALLCGFALAHAFRALILVPTTLVLVVASVAVATYLSYGPWSVLLAQAATVSTLQLGYLLGLGSRSAGQRFWTWIWSTDPGKVRGPAHHSWVAGRR